MHLSDKLALNGRTVQLPSSACPLPGCGGVDPVLTLGRVGVVFPITPHSSLGGSLC